MTTPLPTCGVARFLTLLDGPWATLVVRELLRGPQRFGELRDALPGISPHTLTSRLRRFEAHGIVTRTVHAEIPPRVVYELTPFGRELRTVLDAMAAWATAIPTPEPEQEQEQGQEQGQETGAGAGAGGIAASARN
ncbi:helix-turn-helix domain-containing protein [Streptomyces sp. NPDC047315]|uniref:winged helix-turn-helix transcriptional regulator n=1 Tax=Streptomyces sp. NPDC047315 TaxID=3155142 RepID=UPI0033EC7451